MGFRFRKSVTLFPGVRLNLSKSGVSTSVGRPGATVNLGSGGVRGNVGLPGTGLSYNKRLTRGGGRGFWWLGLALFALFAVLSVGKLFGGSTRSHEARSSTFHPAAASSAHCACGTSTCTGPRGGHYCLMPEGAKRYIR